MPPLLSFTAGSLLIGWGLILILGIGVIYAPESEEVLKIPIARLVVGVLHIVSLTSIFVGVFLLIPHP